MPYIRFEAGKLSKEVKKELIDKLTDVSVEVTGIPKEYFFINICENEDENIALGKKTVKEIKEKLKKA